LVGQEEEVTANEVIAELTSIVAVHPDAGTAQVWGSMKDGKLTHNFHVLGIGYDRRHHPPRVKLEN